MANSVSVSLGADVAKFMAGLQSAADAAAQTAAAIKDRFSSAADSVDKSATQMDAALESLNRTVDAKVTVDGADATARLDNLKAKIDEFSHAVATAKTRVDDTDAEASLLHMEAALDRLGAKTAKPTITVSGVAEAEAKLLAIQAELEKLRDEKIDPKVDINTSGVFSGSLSTEMKSLEKDAAGAGSAMTNLGSSAGSASSGLSGTTQAAIALGPALIPIASGIGGIAAALPAMGAGAASAFGALYLGFSGIAEAVSAIQAPVAATGQSMDALKTAQNSAAQSAASAAQTIVSAQQALGSAVATQANDAITATEALGNAQQALANAVQAAGNAQVQAAQSVLSAQQALAGSEQSLSNAQHSELTAQQALTQARIDAANAITNLNDQVASGALAQQQAALNVQQAQLALQQGGGGYNAAQLQLNYETALQNQKNLADQQSQLQQQQQQANQRGVEGSTAVQSALQAVVSATQAVGNAYQAVGNASTALNQAEVTGAQQVASAQQAVGNAVQSLGDVQRNNARQALGDSQSVANAQTALSTAYRNQQFQAEQSSLAIKNAMMTATGQTSALQQAMANLTPAGQQFVQFLQGSLLPQFNALKAQVQDALLPGIENGLKAMQPAINVFAGSIVSAGQGIGTWFTAFGQIIGQGPGLAEFTKIIQLGQQFMSGMGSAALDVVNGVLSIGSQAGPVIQVIVDAVGGIAQEFANWASGPGGQQFIQNAVSALQALGPTLTSVAKFAEALATTFGPVGSMILGLVKTLADKLTPVIQDLAPDIKIFADALGGILTAAIKQLAPFLDQVVKALAGPLGDAIKQATPALITMAETILSKMLPAFLQMMPAIAQILPPLASLITAIAPLIADGAMAAGAIAGLAVTVSHFATDWYSRWDDIKTAASDAWHWIDQNLVQPFTNFFTGIGSFVKQKFDEVVNNIKAIPGQIASVASTMWDGITGAFKAAMNFVVDLWNNTIGSLSFTIPSWVPGIGGDGFSFPKLPHMELGGTAAGGLPVIVGEKGPELFVPNSTGTVIPHGPTMSLLAAGAPGTSMPGGVPVTGPSTVNNIHVPVTTNADPWRISNEIAWSMKTMAGAA